MSDSILHAMYEAMLHGHPSGVAYDLSNPVGTHAALARDRTRLPVDLADTSRGYFDMDDACARSYCSIMGVGALERKERILVGIESGSRPYHALIRGYQIAKSCDAELVVVHVLPAGRLARWKLPFRRQASDVADAVARDLELITTMQRWCDHVLPEPLGASYLVRRGELVDCVAEEAASIGARLAVVAAESVEPRHASELANDLRTAVLLARPRSGKAVVVAATDLTDPSYPVLNEAAHLAPAIATRLVCVYNRPPALPGMEPMTALLLPVPAITGPTEYGDRRVLRVATASVDASADQVVTRQPRAVDAILEVARARDADLIVVGASRHNSIYRWLIGSTAAAVARRAKRSVLFAPVEAG